MVSAPKETMMQESPVRDKSYTFALRIVGVARQLQDEKREYVLSRQLLRILLHANLKQREK